MMAVVGQLFVSAINVTGTFRWLLILPLCLSIAVVYKTTRCERLREVPPAALTLWVTIVVGMYAVGIGLWVLFTVMV